MKSLVLLLYARFLLLQTIPKDIFAVVASDCQKILFKLINNKAKYVSKYVAHNVIFCPNVYRPRTNSTLIYTLLLGGGGGGGGADIHVQIISWHSEIGTPPFPKKWAYPSSHFSGPPSPTCRIGLGRCLGLPTTYELAPPTKCSPTKQKQILT